jgi:Ricin-type beta-trefoil lectin domain-like
LDVAGSSTANGTYIYQWAAVPYAPFQKWTASAQGGATLALTNVGSQKVLEVGGYATADGGGIQQWQWVGHNFQKWRLEVSEQDAAGFWYKMVNVGSGKVADVSGVSVADGARLTQYSSWGGYNQQFRFTAAP